MEGNPKICFCCIYEAVGKYLNRNQKFNPNNKLLLQQNKIYLSNNELCFNSIGADYTYGILITYPEKNQSLHYETDIIFKKEASGRGRVFSINRRQTYINNKLPEAKLYELTD